MQRNIPESGNFVPAHRCHDEICSNIPGLGWNACTILRDENKSGCTLISYQGTMPKISGSVNLLDGYVYQSASPDFNGSAYGNVSYFLLNENASKILGLDATVKC